MSGLMKSPENNLVVGFMSRLAIVMVMSSLSKWMYFCCAQVWKTVYDELILFMWTYVVFVGVSRVSWKPQCHLFESLIMLF